MTVILITILMLVIFGALGYWAKRAFGCCCHECGRKMLPFRQLSNEDRGGILAYFRSFEDRELDTDGVFVCENCHLVYDDFSGERRSMEGDDKSICKTCNTFGVWYMGPLMNSGVLARFQKQNRALVERIECLRCQRNPSGLWDCIGCDTKVKVTGCRNCYTIYAWMSVHGSRYKFLVLLTNKEVLKKAVDSKWGLFEV